MAWPTTHVRGVQAHVILTPGTTQAYELSAQLCVANLCGFARIIISSTHGPLKEWEHHQTAHRTASFDSFSRSSVKTGDESAAACSLLYCLGPSGSACLACRCIHRQTSLESCNPTPEVYSHSLNLSAGTAHTLLRGLCSEACHELQRYALTALPLMPVCLNVHLSSPAPQPSTLPHALAPSA